jgi:hypothetical protein
VAFEVRPSVIAFSDTVYMKDQLCKSLGNCVPDIEIDMLVWGLH